MVDWVAAVLTRRRASADSSTKEPAPMDSADHIAEPGSDTPHIDRPSLAKVPLNDSRLQRLVSAIAELSTTDFQAGDFIERFCLQTVDGGLSDHEAIESIVTSLPQPSYDFILAEISVNRLPTSEDHAEAVTRWMQYVRVQHRCVTKLLESLSNNNVLDHGAFAEDLYAGPSRTPPTQSDAAAQFVRTAPVRRGRVGSCPCSCSWQALLGPSSDIRPLSDAAARNMRVTLNFPGLALFFSFSLEG